MLTENATGRAHVLVTLLQHIEVTLKTPSKKVAKVNALAECKGAQKASYSKRQCAHDIETSDSKRFRRQDSDERVSRIMSCKRADVDVGLLATRTTKDGSPAFDDTKTHLHRKDAMGRLS